MIAAILRAQFLSMRIGRTGAGVGAARFSIATAFLWYGFWCFVAASAAEMTARAAGPALDISLRAGLFLVLFYWQAMPVLSASMGAGIDLRKLLVYPIPHAQLFWTEALLRLVSGSEMLLVLAGGAAGLLRNPAVGAAAAPRAALAILLFVAFNVWLATGLRSLLERLLARGRVREIVVLALLVLFMLPRFFVLTGTRVQWFRNLAVMREDGLPWTLTAHLLLGHAPLAAACGLCAFTALAALFGRWQFERSLRFDTAAANASTSRGGNSRSAVWARLAMERFYRFPALLLPDPLAALVEKELRTLVRSPRFRTVFIMGFSFGLLVWLPLVAGRRASPGGALAQDFLAVVSVYALTLLGQVSYWNAFGFDRSAVQIYYAAPLAASHVILAKNLAALVFVYLETGILIAVTLLFRLGIRPGKIAEALLVVTVCAVYLIGLGNLSSVHYPRGLNPERVSQGGASGRFQALVFLLYPLATLPVFLAYAARYLLGSGLVFWILFAIAALIGGALYWIATESAIHSAAALRERMVQQLSAGEGPVVS